MSQNIMRGGVEDVTAQLKSDFEASRNGFAANMGKLKGEFEASKTKFNADLEAISPRKRKVPAKPISSGNWILARKVWGWLNSI